MKDDIFSQFDDLLRVAGEDGITAADLMKAKGCSRNTAIKSIGQKIAAGVVEYAGKRRVINIMGGAQMVPVYRLVRKGKRRS